MNQDVFEGLGILYGNTYVCNLLSFPQNINNQKIRYRNSLCIFCIKNMYIYIYIYTHAYMHLMFVIIRLHKEY